MKRLFSSVLAAFLLAGQAQAYVLDFESVDSSNAPFAPLLVDGDVVTQGAYFINTQDVNRGGGLIGQLSNGSDPGSCLNGVCPGGNSTNYLSIYNDGIAHFGLTSGAPIVFGGLSAAFIRPPEASAKANIYLAVEADRTDGSYAVYAYPLKSNGSFMDVAATGGQLLDGTGTLTSGVVSDLFVYGYYCDGISGGCSAFRTNNAQFALDDIVLTAAVPEPETYAMMLAGLGLMGIISRRRRLARFDFVSKM